MARAGGALATLLAVLACVVLPVAVVSSWLRLQVEDTDRYVATVTPLGTTPEVRAAVIDEVERQVGGTLPAGFDQSLLARAQSSAAFRSAWVSGNAQAHRELIAILADDPDNPDEADIHLDSGALLGDQAVIPPRVAAAFAVNLDLVSSRDLAHARAGYRVVDAIWFWPAVGWGALVLLALLLPGARRRVLTVLGIGSLLSLGLLAGVLLLARSEVTGLGNRTHGDLIGVFWDALLHSMWVSMAVLAAVAGLVLIARFVVGVASPARRYAD